jgi:hypothetical protein
MVLLLNTEDARTNSEWCTFHLVTQKEAGMILELYDCLSNITDPRITPLQATCMEI